jgi:hypothetical protein
MIEAQLLLRILGPIKRYIMDLQKADAPGKIIIVYARHK